MTSCFYEMINTNHVIGHRELCYVVIGTSQQIRWWKILLQHPLWFQIIQFVHFVFRLQRSSHIATRVNCQKETFTKLQNFSNLFMYIRVFFSARKIGMVRCKYGNLSFIFPAPITVRIQHLFNEITSLYRGADKSLARPGSEQTNVSVRMAWISFGALPFREKKKTWWQLASRCCWSRARPWHASELVSFLAWLRTYQHPGIQTHTTVQYVVLKDL